MGTNGTRIFKIEWFMPRIDAVMRAGGIVDKEKLISEFCIFFGSTRRTALEILSHLQGSGRIIIRGNQIWTIAGWEAEKILNKANLISGAKIKLDIEQITSLELIKKEE